MSVWRRAITGVTWFFPWPFAWFFAWFFLWAHPPCSLAQEGVRAVTESIQIPARPELLHFEDSVYPAPRGEDYRHTLSNGLTVYVVEDHSVPIVDVTMALPVGDFLDPPGQVGLASLSALLVRRGGTLRLEAERFDQEADHLAIEINSLGGTYRSGVTLNCSSTVLDQALRLFADAVRRPRFQADRVELALRNLRASALARARQPNQDPARSWSRLMYGADHPRSRRVSEEHLANLDAASLRAFHRRSWLPSEMVIAVAGDADTRSVLQLLEEQLGDWEPAAQVAPRPKRVSSSMAEAGVYWLEAAPERGLLLIGHEGLLRRSWDDPNLFAGMVMAEVLGGGGAVSRLSSRLRGQESLVYRVDASLGIGLYEQGLFEVSLGVAPQHAVRAAQGVFEELRRMRRVPPGKVELDLAKRAMVDGFPLLFDSAEQRAGRFAEDALLGRPHRYWRFYRDRIAAVNERDVLRAARRYLRPDRLRVLWIGPQLPEGSWASLGLGKPRTLNPKRPADAGSVVSHDG